jgi:two-component system, chemotaxis family, chemotaxis protein CheY
MKFLVVEDDVVSYTIVEKILSRFGVCVIATDGLAAITTFEAAVRDGERFDLVCLDIMLPGMDGQEVLKHLRTIEEKQGILGEDGVKVVMITALGDNRNILEAFRSQCEGYIIKPVTKEKILLQLTALGLLRDTNVKK